ncbi:hypothetical protein ACQ86E_20745 [Bradyrhizobium betae]|uniref:hypothetical protein n=1 Tax=Bradyrhizobium betae TaxID=244734 RepID=UPI003D665491
MFAPFDGGADESATVLPILLNDPEAPKNRQFSRFQWIQLYQPAEFGSRIPRLKFVMRQNWQFCRAAPVQRAPSANAEVWGFLMDQNEARAIVGGVFSRGMGTWVLGILIALFIFFHIFVAGFGMVDLAYCNVRPGWLQLFEIFGPLLAFGLFIALRALIPGDTQIPGIVAWSLVAIIISINAWFFFTRESVLNASDLYDTRFCKVAQAILPFQQMPWGKH